MFEIDDWLLETPEGRCLYSSTRSAVTADIHPDVLDLT